MTTVWTTQGGVRYHAHHDCAALAAGQEKALREGKSIYHPEPVELSSLGSRDVVPTPCLYCWQNEPGWTSWLRVELATELHSGAKDGSPYELVFLRTVLKEIPGLDPGYIRVQYPIERRVGGLYKPDFAITMPERAPLVLEVDGLNKGPDQRPDYAEYTLERDEELRQLGYQVQHFTNAQVITNPTWCRDVVSRLIRPAPSAELAARTPAAAAGQKHQDRPSASGNAGRAFAVALVALCVIAGVGVGTVWLLSRTDSQTLVSQAPDQSGQCDDAYPIKGNQTEDGDLIYHLRGGQFYDRTTAVECFATPADAEDAGYRESQR